MWRNAVPKECATQKTVTKSGIGLLYNHLLSHSVSHLPSTSGFQNTVQPTCVTGLTVIQFHHTMISFLFENQLCSTVRYCLFLQR